MSVDPYVVYILVNKDKSGNPRGVEKSTGHLYFSEIDAKRDIAIFSNLIIQECVIMSRENYDQLVNNELPR